MTKEELKDLEDFLKDPYFQALKGLVALPSNMNRSLASFAQAIAYYLREEQGKVNPDNGLISLLCDAARLGAEQIEAARTDFGKLRSALKEAEAKIAELSAEVREWLCVQCNTVYPGPPQMGVWCLQCPKCLGDCGPRGVMERRALTVEVERLREALKSYAECSDGCTCGDGWSHDIAEQALASKEPQ